MGLAFCSGQFGSSHNTRVSTETVSREQINMGTLVATRYNPVIRVFYLKLRTLAVVYQFERSSNASNSSAVQIWSVRPAAIAGVRL